jgi:hypothetical protein
MDAESYQSAYRSVVIRFVTETDKVNEHEKGVGAGEGSVGKNDGNVSQLRSQVLGNVRK